MRSGYSNAIAAVAVASALAACATLPPPGTALTPEQRQKAQRDCILQYTVVGAVGGALMGQLLGGNTRSTLIGAAAGGALGTALAWGHCLNVYSDLKSFPVADARQTAAQTGWQPSRGNEVKIQSFAAVPAEVRAGSSVALDGAYYLMAPGEVKDVKVVETRSVSFYDPEEKRWKALGSVDQPVTAALGTRRAEGKFDLPSDVPEGRYRIELKVSALGKTDALAQEITVRRA
jgi:hypothetical protein